MSLITVSLGQSVALDEAKMNALVITLECWFALMCCLAFFNQWKSTKRRRLAKAVGCLIRPKKMHEMTKRS